MFGLDHHTAENNSESRCSVVRRLDPELDSEFATPRHNLPQPRIYSGISPNSNDDEFHNIPKKKLKGVESTFDTPLGGGLRMLGDLPSELMMSDQMLEKENYEPMNSHFQQPPKKASKKGRGIVDSLFPEEAAKLLEIWESNHFIDFNSWLQVAKAKISMTLSEKIHTEASNAEKTFTSRSYDCHMQLYFAERNEEGLISNGLGKSKKEAKKMSVKQMVIMLIQKDLICLGLRDKKFIYAEKGDTRQPLNRLQEDLGKLANCAEERNRRLKREMKKLSKRMQLSLKENNFIEACQYFCQIISNKIPDWNEISQIWCYAILKKEAKYARVILDLLQYRRVKINLDDDEKDDTDNTHISNPKREEAQRHLKYLYGFGREKCHNPYDLYDFDNFENVKPESIPGEIRRRETSLLDASRFTLNMDLITSSLHHLETEELDNLMADYAGQAKLGFDEVTKQSSDIQNKLLGYETPQCNIKINMTNNKEFKDSNINYLSPKLINELYDSLIYSGDAKFCVKVAEMIYSRSRLDDEEFASPYAAYYYAQRKNMLNVELIESVFSAYMNPEGSLRGVVKLAGQIEKIGYKFKQQVVMFKPGATESNISLDELIVRRGVNVPKEIAAIRDNGRVNEGEVVLLICFSQDPETKIDHEFNDLLNEEAGIPIREKDLKEATLESIISTPFFKRYVSRGRSIRHAMFALATDISKEFHIKLYTLPTSKQAYEIADACVEWNLLRISVPGHLYEAQQALFDFTTKGCANPALSHILFCPPLTCSSYLRQLYDKRADLQIHQSMKTKNQIKLLLSNLSQRLDASQLEVVSNALCKSFSLVHATNSSGKMACIVEIVNAWLSLSTATILVVSGSNLKADMLHMALSKAGVTSVRLFASPDEVDDEVYGPEFNDAVEHMKEANTYFNSYYVRYPVLKKLITGASVICTTLDAMSGEYFSSCSFPRVIVDDGSCVIEPLLLSILTHNCQHVVMFGDHQAVPPKVNSELAITKGLKISLFERLIMQGYPNVFLEFQYLVNPSISFFSSYKFYNFKLKNGTDKFQLPPVGGFPWPNPEVPIAFINISDAEERTIFSYQNTSEAELLVQLFVKILAHKELDISEIGALTCYTAQQELIQAGLETAAQVYPSVFGTQEEGFSNRAMVDICNKEKLFDKEIMLFSAVRSNNDGKLGPLRDERILNSILSKGRRGLVIIGNISTLAANSAWNEFLYWAQSNSIILNYN